MKALVIVFLAMIGLCACEEKKATPPVPAAAALPTGLFLGSAPSDAKPVDEAKQAAKEGDEVVIRGRVGGSRDPFVAGRAVFTIMTPRIPSCADNPDDACKTPWDYCCESKEDIATHSATIQVVDAAGAPLKAGIKGQNGIKELSELVIVGKVARAEGKVLVVNASGVFVEQQ